MDRSLFLAGGSSPIRWRSEPHVTLAQPLPKVLARCLFREVADIFGSTENRPYRCTTGVPVNSPCDRRAPVVGTGGAGDFVGPGDLAVGEVQGAAPYRKGQVLHSVFAAALGISYELSQCGSLEMLGQVSNSTELIGRLDEGDCDVVIVDYTMPGGKYGDGLALLSLLRRRYPHLQLVVFTMLNNPGLIRAILKQGINCMAAAKTECNT